MDLFVEPAALPPDDGLALEGSTELSEEPLSGFVMLSLLTHLVGLLGYFAFPPVCLHLFRAFTLQRPGRKNAAASVAVGVLLAVACQAAVGLLLYCWSLHDDPSLSLDDNTFLLSWVAQTAVKYLGPLALAVPVFSALRKLLPNRGTATLASGFGLAYLLVFCIPFAGFMLFNDYANLLADPEFLLRPAGFFLGVGLAAVPVFLLLLRSLVRQVTTVPGPCLTAATAAYVAIPLLAIPAWLFKHLAYAGRQMAALWPDTAIQTLADCSLLFADPLWAPVLTALAAAGVLKLCTGRVISGTQGRLAKTMVFLGAASLYMITACLLLFGGHSTPW